MGLFGRDDRAQPSKSPEAGQPSRPESQNPPGSLGNRTVITDTILIEGTISGAGQITVNGRVRGTIDGQNEVNIASRGRVEASVHGREVVVAGSVVGDISADARIELEPTAHVDGDITAPRILIRDGATFRGKVNMKPPEPRGAAASPGPRTGAAKPDHS